MSPIHQLFSIYPISMLIGIAKTNALKAESCLGEIFLVENIIRRYRVHGTRIKAQAARESSNYRTLVPCLLHLVPSHLEFKFIPNSLHCCNAINTQFLTDFADVDINGAVANNYIITPYLVKYFIAKKNTAGLLG